MITKHMKTAVITELAMETPCLPPEERARLYTMLTDTFAVEIPDTLPDGWKLRVLLRDGSPDADTPGGGFPGRRRGGKLGGDRGENGRNGVHGVRFPADP